MTTRASLLGLLLVLPACGFTSEYVGNQAIESPNAKEVNSRQDVLETLGIPTLDEYVEAYCQRTGRDKIPHWNFYLAYNLFRSCGISQGILGRVRDGTAASTHTDQVGKTIPQMAELAWSLAQSPSA